MTSSKPPQPHAKRKSTSKRKRRTSDTTYHGTTASKTSKRSRTFRLLDLPAELRNNIYEKVAEEQTAFISQNSKGNLACASALTSVNRQVRDEFLVVLALIAPKIIAKVSEWDFKHVVRFLNRLSDAELKALPSLSQRSSRGIKLQLCVSYHPRHNIDLLYRWLKRSAHPTKKGTSLDFSYCVVGSIDRSNTCRDPVSHLTEWSQLLHAKSRQLDYGRTKSEVQKITLALVQGAVSLSRP